MYLCFTLSTKMTTGIRVRNCTHVHFYSALFLFLAHPIQPLKVSKKTLNNPIQFHFPLCRIHVAPCMAQYVPKTMFNHNTILIHVYDSFSFARWYPLMILHRSMAPFLEKPISPLMGVTSMLVTKLMFRLLGNNAPSSGECIRRSVLIYVSLYPRTTSYHFTQ